MLIDKEKNIETSLEFKEHSNFFYKYYDLKLEYTQISCDAEAKDWKEIDSVYSACFKFVMFASSQISNDIGIEEIIDKKKEIITLIRKGKFFQALQDMNRFYHKVCKVCSKYHLEPIPVIEEKDEILTEKDDKIRYALEAYRILNAE